MAKSPFVTQNLRRQFTEYFSALDTEGVRPFSLQVPSWVHQDRSTDAKMYHQVVVSVLQEFIPQFQVMPRDKILAIEKSQRVALELFRVQHQIQEALKRNPHLAEQARANQDAAGHIMRNQEEWWKHLEGSYPAFEAAMAGYSVDLFLTPEEWQASKREMFYLFHQALPRRI